MATERVPDEVLEALEAIGRGSKPGDLESETLEFKSARGGVRKTRMALAEAAACLANGHGGSVVLGVDDDQSGATAFSGTDLDELEARRYIFETVTPGLTVGLTVHWQCEARLLVAHVPVGATVHGVAGRVTRRIGRSCLPLAPDEIAALHSERRGVDPSEARSGRTVEDLDPVAMEVARGELRRLGGERERWAELPNAELCSTMGLASPDGGLCIAGEQLLCATGEEIVVYQHRLSVGSPPDATERIAMPLLPAFGRVLELVASRNPFEPLLLPNGQQIQMHRYPPGSIREAVANALVHRRLDIAEPVRVEHFDDALSVTSMGPFVSGVTVHNILSTTSRPRNRLLARAFRALGLIEELGTGVARMYRSMLSLGKPPPTISGSAEAVRVQFDGGPAEPDFASYVALLEDAQRNDVELLLVLRRLCASGTVAPTQMAHAFQRPETDAARAMQRMAADTRPLIEPSHARTNGPSTRYRLTAEATRGLGSAVRRPRRDSSEIEDTIAAHVNKHGRINNQVVRNLLGVGTPRASAILRELVDREVLERITDAPRGPSVAYGPGPRFEI